MKKKIILITCIIAAVILIVAGLVLIGNILAPGSYVYAERYEIKANQDTLIKAILNFKENNPEYKLPETTHLKDGRGKDDDNKYFYFIYFYYPEENQIVFTYTRPETKKITTFAFLGINQTLNLGNSKQINKDFSSDENEEQKKKFEDRILNKIKKRL